MYEYILCPARRILIRKPSNQVIEKAGRTEEQLMIN